MTLHLVRLRIDMLALAGFAARRRIDDDDGGYALHCALAGRFGAAAPRPFRFLPDQREAPTLLGYATDWPALEEAARLPALDDGLDAIFDAPQGRAMPDAWRAGARYGFEVRVRPVVRFGKAVRARRGDREDAWQKRAGEIDAYVAACERAVLAGGDAAEVDREAVYLAWLAQRLAGAAAIESAGVRMFTRTRSRRSTHGTGGARTRPVEGPDSVIAGTLAVADPAAFAALLASGVGRHAAFGYGMLLLHAAGRPG